MKYFYSEAKPPRKDRKSVILDEVLMAAIKANPTISSMRNAWGAVPEDEIDVEIVRKWLESIFVCDFLWFTFL